MIYPSEVSPVLDTKPGGWKRVDLGTFTAPTNRVKAWTSFRGGTDSMMQYCGAQGQFILRPNGNTSTTGQIIVTDSGDGYYDFDSACRYTSVELGRVNVTAGTTYDVVFLGRVSRNLGSPSSFSPTLSKLTCMLDPA